MRVCLRVRKATMGYVMRITWCLVFFCVVGHTEQVSESVQSLMPNKKNTISFHFKDIETRSALQMLAEFSKKNMVINDCVHGHVTLRLHELSFEQALTAILTSQGLTQRVMGHVLWIDCATSGSTWSAKPQKKPMPRHQFVIEAKIVTLSKEGARDLGVRLGLAEASTTDTRVGSWPHDRLSVDLGAMPLEASAASMGLALTALGTHLLDLELSALESEGRASVMASPRLMTLNHHAAIIESGEDIPYQEATTSGATSVSFKKAVLRLKVTPHLTPEGAVLMRIVINQDSDSGRRVQGVPILLTKSLKTQVLIKNGQTIVLGGIEKQDKHHATVKVPWLGALPWIGPFFRRNHVHTHEEEMLVFITPRQLV